MKNTLRLSLRYVIQIISLIFFYYLFTTLLYPLGWQADLLKLYTRLDPWTLFNHLRGQHYFPVWGWLPILTLFVTLVLGRIFCGWLCPFGAVLMLSDKLGRWIEKSLRLKKITKLRLNMQKRLLPVRTYWLLFLVIIFMLGSNLPYSFTPFALFSHEIVRILKREIPWGMITIIAITILFSRLWCGVLCPTGALLSFFGRFRFFRYQASDQCVHCSKCARICSVGMAPTNASATGEGCLVCGECQLVCPTKAINFKKSRLPRNNTEGALEAAAVEPDNLHSRRQFLKITGAGILATAAVLGSKTVYAEKKVLRPPGALPETAFRLTCNRCGRCIKVCPNNALQPMPLTEGLECFETPQIIPREANCYLCLSCQEVCPTGAISKVVELEQIHMGKAKLNTQTCLAWKENKLCLICVEQCPMGAIICDEQMRPVVLTDQCVGCGSCEKCCALDGEAAVRVYPN